MYPDQKTPLHARPIIASIHSPKDWSVEKVIKALGNAGYDGIDYGEIGSIQPQIAQLKMWRKMAEDAGLMISSLHFRDFGFDALTSKDHRDKFLRDSLEDLKIAAALGCREIAFHIADTPNLTRKQFVDSNIDLFSEPVRVAGDLGVRVCIENHYLTKHGRTAKDLLAILEGLDSPDGSGICLDTGHGTLTGQNPATMIHEAGEHLKLLHLHDNMGHKDTHLSPGLGIIDWFSVFAALDEIRFPGPLNMEIGGHHPHDEISTSAIAGYHNILQLLSEYYIICA